MTDTADRLRRLEVKLGFRDAEPPPPEGGTDQFIASYALGLEAELAEAKGRKDRVQVDATTAAMTELLDRLGPQRRKAVQRIMAADRETRGQPMPQMVWVWGPYGMNSGSTETRHYADGRVETIDAATGEAASPPATFGPRS